jgi:hypothetical protein
MTHLTETEPHRVGDKKIAFAILLLALLGVLADFIFGTPLEQRHTLTNSIEQKDGLH